MGTHPGAELRDTLLLLLTESHVCPRVLLPSPLPPPTLPLPLSTLLHLLPTFPSPLSPPLVSFLLLILHFSFLGFETGSHCAAQASLEFTFLLPQPWVLGLQVWEIWPTSLFYSPTTALTFPFSNCFPFPRPSFSGNLRQKQRYAQTHIALPTGYSTSFTIF